MRRAHLASLSLSAALTTAALTAPVRADDNVVQQAPTTQPAPAAPAAAPQPVVVQPTAVQPAPVAAPAATNDSVVQQTNVTSAPERERPSIFKHGYQGLLAGVLVGAGSGYLVGRKDGWERSDWRAVGLGIGVGSLAGAGLGLSLGFADRADSPGSRYIARDLVGGAAFGGVIGTIVGGISAAAKDDAEHVLFGASIGVLAGAGLGVITGIVEGQTRERETAQVTTSNFRMRPDLTVARAANGSSVVAPGLVGVF